MALSSHTIFGAVRFNAPGFLAGIDFAPDGRTLVALAPGERTKLHRFRVELVEHGELVEERAVPGDWRGIVCLSDGGFLLWAPLRGAVARFDAGGAPVWEVETNSQSSFDFVSALRDGSLVATYGGESCAHIYDGRSGEILQTVREPKGEIFALAFSSDGSLFATGSQTGIVRVFDRKAESERGHRKSTKVLALAFSPDGSMLAGGHGQGDISLWQVPSLRPVSGFRGAAHRFFEDYGQGEQDVGPAGCRWLSFTPDGKGLVSSGNDHGLRFWDLEGSMKRRVRIAPHHPQGSAMALSPDGRWVAAGSTLGALSVWTGSGDLVVDQRSTASPHGIALSRGHVAVAGQHALRSWDRETGQVKEQSISGPSAVFALPKDRLLVLATQSFFVVDDVEKKGHKQFALEGYTQPGLMALSRDRTRVAVALDHKLGLWDWDRGVLLASIPHEGTVRACAFGPDDQWIVSVVDKVCLWPIGDPSTPLRTIALEDGAPEICHGVAVSPRGWIAVSIDRTSSNHGSDSALVFIDPRSGAVTATLPHPKARLGQVVFVDDVRAVIVDSSGGIFMADAEKGAWVDLPKPPESERDEIAFDFRPLAVSEDGAEVAYLDAMQNVVVLKISKVDVTAGEPFVLERAAPPAEAPESSAMFEERLAGATFLFTGKFQQSSISIRTTPEFREEGVRELGGVVVKKPKKGITHLVAARASWVIPGTKASALMHVPTAAEIAVDRLITGGETIVKLSEEEMIELFLPTFAEARAMLTGAIEGGVERWNRWRSRYSSALGERFQRLLGIDLSGVDLRKAALTVIHFEEACLRGANLAGVDLFDCVFRRADLRGANLSGAKCYRTVFANADLREAKLDANFTWAVFTGADLRGADLRNADLSHAKLDGAKLDGAKLPENAPKE